MCSTAVFDSRERYLVEREDHNPQPVLTGVVDPIGDDAYSALFLGILLSYLDIDATAKVQNNESFQPVLELLEEVDLGAIYADWSPSTALSQLGATLDPRGANAYVRQVHNFRKGLITANKVGEGIGDLTTYMQSEAKSLRQDGMTK